MGTDADSLGGGHLEAGGAEPVAGPFGHLY